MKNFKFKAYILVSILVCLTAIVFTINLFLSKHEKVIEKPKSSVPMENINLKYFVSDTGLTMVDAEIDLVKKKINGTYTGHIFEMPIAETNKKDIEKILNEYDISNLKSAKSKKEDRNVICDGNSYVSINANGMEIWSGGLSCGECFPENSCAFYVKITDLLESIVIKSHEEFMKKTYTNIKVCTDEKQEDREMCFYRVAEQTKDVSVCDNINIGTRVTRSFCISHVLIISDKPELCFVKFNTAVETDQCLKEVSIYGKRIDDEKIHRVCNLFETEADKDLCYKNWGMEL